MSASRAEPPSSSARARRCSAPNPDTTTRAPSAVKRRAMASPMPPGVDAPRTIATLFSRSFTWVPFVQCMNSNFARRALVYRERSIGPLSAHRFDTVEIAFFDQLHGIRMRPYEKLLRLDPLRHKVTNELGAHTIS